MSDNTVHSNPSFYRITVVTDENSVNVTQGITKVVRVNTPGPQGPAGTGGGGSSDLTALNSFSASILTFTSSIQAQVNNLTTATSSYVLTSVTSSMVVSGALTASYFRETDPIFSSKSASLVTTGSNTFIGSQVITGSVTITNNLTVLGSQSIQYITSSQLDISTNLITVNTSTPAVRFGGLAVRDSGSLATGLTGSLLWDSQNNVWIYSNPSGAAYDGGIVLMGPRNTSGLGNEVGIAANTLAKGDGSHHVTSSQITDDGSTVTIPGNLSVNGLTISSPLNQDIEIKGFFKNFNSIDNLGSFSRTEGNFAGYYLEVNTSIDTFVSPGDLVYFNNVDQIWYKVDQTTDSSTKMLGICVMSGTLHVLLEGDIVLNNDAIAGGGNHGLPVFITGSGGYSTRTDSFNSGYVRTVGHLYYNYNDGSGTDYWVLKFKPSNDWMQIA